MALKGMSTQAADKIAARHSAEILPARKGPGWIVGYTRHDRTYVAFDRDTKWIYRDRGAFLSHFEEGDESGVLESHEREQE